MSEHPDVKLRERLAAYALGSMDPDELREFELELDRHLADGCPACEQALAEYSESVVALAGSTPEARPDPGLRGRVLAAVAGEASRREATTSTRRGSWGFLRWAAILIVGVAGLAGWLEFFEARRALRDRDLEVARLETRLEEVRQQLEQGGRIRGLMVASKRLEVVPLEAAEPGAAAPLARVAYDADSARAVALFEDATPPAGRDYQLWALAGDTVQSLGVIRADASGRAELEAQVLAAAAELQGFAVSLEPEGGSPDPHAPSGPVVSVGLRTGA